ncbi:hypothetical protein [Natronomonas amylolytica]|uniref:hypothetical protein n=1 Tax=Natronomonas amylolytica TaxID=3108498 RepID=UPI00300B1FCD
MTADGTGPTTDAELNAELETILHRANENGIDVRGGWECRNGPESPDWDVLITEVEKPDASD